MGTDKFYEDLFMRTIDPCVYMPFKTPRPYKLKVDLPKKYIINENATILFWEDGTKTIVKKCEEDEFNARLAFLTAFFQHYCGMSKNKANRYLANLQYGEEIKTHCKYEMLDKVIDKLKVGDKVIVKNDLELYKQYDGCSVVKEMMNLKGKAVEISSIEDDECYKIKEDGEEWYWTIGMFEKRIPKHMKEDK